MARREIATLFSSANIYVSLCHYTQGGYDGRGENDDHDRNIDNNNNNTNKILY